MISSAMPSQKYSWSVVRAHVGERQHRDRLAPDGAVADGRGALPGGVRTGGTVRACGELGRGGEPLGSGSRARARCDRLVHRLRDRPGRATGPAGAGS